MLKILVKNKKGIADGAVVPSNPDPTKFESFVHADADADADESRNNFGKVEKRKSFGGS